MFEALQRDKKHFLGLHPTQTGYNGSEQVD